MKASPGIVAAIDPPWPGRGQQARRALLEAGLQVFADHGPANATTRQIARLAGQNIAAIAYYFGSKEGLYLAVAEEIVERMQSMMGAPLAQAEGFLGAKRRSPERALEYLKMLLAALVQALTRRETVNYSKILMREQLEPSAAFAVLYEQGIGPLHRGLCGLLAVCIEDRADAERVLLHGHALLGTALVFRTAHETILRRGGWSQLGENEVAAITATVAEHAECLVRGLKPARRQAPEASP